MDVSDIQVGAWYQRIDNTDQLVKVTAMNKFVAFDVHDPGQVGKTFSTLKPDTFARLYQPRD